MKIILYNCLNEFYRDMKSPKVSILCLTFNQEKFIKQTLESFLNQQTDFGFEVLINDDASTDDTQKIIKQFQKKYPDIIKPVFQKTNRYSKGERNFIPRFLIPRAKGEFLAICEGDDYWTDPQKLQLQVDFLEAHPNYALCFHPVEVVYENAKDKNMIFPDVEDESWYTNEELLKTNYIPTNSVMYRKQTYGSMPDDIAPGDWYMHLYHAQFGKIKFLSKVMSVYRKHDNGVWREYDTDRDAIWRKYGLQHVTMLNELLKIYGKDKKKAGIIHDNIDRLLEAFIPVDKKFGDGLLARVFERYPEYGAEMVQKKAAIVAEHEAKMTEMWQVINDLKKALAASEQELEDIKKSYAWKLENKMKNLKNKNAPRRHE